MWGSTSVITTTRSGSVGALVSVSVCWEACEPERNVAGVAISISARLGVAKDAVALRLLNKTGCAGSRVQVVIGEMVERTLSDRTARVDTGFKRDGNVESRASGLARAARNDPCLRAIGRADGAFMGMAGEKLDRTCRC